MPAAGCESAEDAVARGLLVEMEGLRIEFGGKRLDSPFVDAEPPGAEGLPHGEVVKISFGHLICGPDR
jgi:hypothetical protein